MDIEDFEYILHCGDRNRIRNAIAACPPGHFERLGTTLTVRDYRNLDPTLLADYTLLASKQVAINIGGQHFDTNFLLAWLKAVKQRRSASQPRLILNWNCPNRWDLPEGGYWDGLDQLAHTLCSCDIVSQIGLGIENFEGHVARALASFVDILDKKSENLNLIALYAIHAGVSGRVERYLIQGETKVDTFQELLASLSRNTKLKSLALHTDKSSDTLLKDCILPALCVNRSIQKLILDMQIHLQDEVEEVSVSDQIFWSVWSKLCDIISSNPVLKSIEVRFFVSVREDNRGIRAAFDQFRERYSERIRTSLLRNFNLERVHFAYRGVLGTMHWSAMNDMVQELVNERNQLLQSVRAFVTDQQRDPNQQLIREKFAHVHAAVMRSSSHIVSFYELVRGCLPTAADQALKACLLQAMGSK